MLSHLTDEGPDPQSVAHFTAVFEHAGEPMVLHSRTGLGDRRPAVSDTARTVFHGSSETTGIC